MHYRLAVPEDAPAFLQIYSEYIRSKSAKTQEHLPAQPGDSA